MRKVLKELTLSGLNSDSVFFENQISATANFKIEIMRSKAKEINIWSFYRAPVEVMAEIRRWREFAAGDDHSVELKDAATGEIVAVDFVDDWGDGASVSIKSQAPGDFFDRVIGRIVRLMSERSGYLKIRRTPYDEEKLFTPKFKRHFD